MSKWKRKRETNTTQQNLFVWCHKSSKSCENGFFGRTKTSFYTTLICRDSFLYWPLGRRWRYSLLVGSSGVQNPNERIFFGLLRDFFRVRSDHSRCLRVELRLATCREERSAVEANSLAKRQLCWRRSQVCDHTARCCRALTLWCKVADGNGAHNCCWLSSTMLGVRWCRGWRTTNCLGKSTSWKEGHRHAYLPRLLLNLNASQTLVLRASGQNRSRLSKRGRAGWCLVSLS